MTGISINFHALPEEILPLLQRFVKETSAYITVTRFPPFTAVSVDASDLEKNLFDPSVASLWFTLAPPQLPADGVNQFLQNNRGALLLDIGRQKDKGLVGSWLTARVEDLEMLKKWRVLANRLRRITTTGAIVFDPKTGAGCKDRDERFSEGAKALWRQGVPLLHFGGIGPQYRFE